MGSFLILGLCFTELSLVSLDGLEGLIVGLVGMIKSNLELVDLSLKLLLDSQTFSLGTLLRLKGGLKGFHGTSVVLASVVELFFLLRNSSVNFLLDLSKFKLSSKDLVLLSLKSALSFRSEGIDGRFQ